VTLGSASPCATPWIGDPSGSSVASVSLIASRTHAESWWEEGPAGLSTLTTPNRSSSGRSAGPAGI